MQLPQRIAASLVLTGVIVTALLLLAVPSTFAQLASLLNRSVHLSDGTRMSTGVTYEHSFFISSSDPVGSIEFEFCVNDPFIGTPCTAPFGFDASSTPLLNQSGEVGFTVHANSTANRIVLTRPPVAVVPQQSTYTFGNITNPQFRGTYYVRLATFAATDGTGPRIDIGGLAFAIEEGFIVTTEVPPFLEFCSAVIIINQDCQQASGDFINLGTLGPGVTRSGTSQFVAATNAQFGYTVTLLGSTMTSGINTVAAMNSRGASATGVNQFGINLRDNASPNIGLEPAGPGTAGPLGDYAVANEFVFRPGDSVVSNPNTNNYRTFTVSYIVNVIADQPPGVYTTTVSFLALASF